MKRGALGLDRLVALVAGLVGVVAGVVAIAWVSGLVKRLFASTPSSVDLHRGYETVFQAAWWPWVAGGGGLVLALVGLWWLLGHVEVNAVRHVRLAAGGSAPDGPAGSLQADSGAVTKAAGQVLSATPGVRSASASLRTDRHQLVLSLDAVVDPAADLAVVAAGAARTAGQVADVTGLESLTTRGRLTVPAHSRG